jgi:hypothetical protein
MFGTYNFQSVTCIEIKVTERISLDKKFTLQDGNDIKTTDHTSCAGPGSAEKRLGVAEGKGKVVALKSRAIKRPSLWADSPRKTGPLRLLTVNLDSRRWKLMISDFLK